MRYIMQSLIYIISFGALILVVTAYPVTTRQLCEFSWIEDFALWCACGIYIAGTIFISQIIGDSCDAEAHL